MLLLTLSGNNPLLTVQLITKELDILPENTTGISVLRPRGKTNVSKLHQIKINIRNIINYIRLPNAAKGPCLLIKLKRECFQIHRI